MFLYKNYFPWNMLPEEIVMGRVAFDNYMVAISNQLGWMTVDGTCSIGAVHLSGKDGDWSKRTRQDVNVKILRRHKLLRHLYSMDAKTSCRDTGYFSDGQNGTIVLRKRIAPSNV